MPHSCLSTSHFIAVNPHYSIRVFQKEKARDGILPPCGSSDYIFSRHNYMTTKYISIEIHRSVLVGDLAGRGYGKVLKNAKARFLFEEPTLEPGDSYHMMA